MKADVRSKLTTLRLHGHKPYLGEAIIHCSGCYLMWAHKDSKIRECSRSREAFEEALSRSPLANISVR